MEHISVSQVVDFRTQKYVTGNLMIPKFMSHCKRAIASYIGGNERNIPEYDEVIS